MNTLRWLAVVAFLAIVLAVAKAIFGDSPVAMAVYIAACMTTIHVLLGVGPWYGIPPAALIATGFFLTFEHAIAADFGGSVVGLVLLITGILALVVIRERQRRRGAY